MGKMFGEPLMVLVGGGTVLVQAVMQTLIAFNVPITGPQQAALTTLFGLIFALLARTQVTPTSALPPGVAGQIANAEQAVKKP